MARAHSERWRHSLVLTEDRRNAVDDILVAVEVEFQAGDLTEDEYLKELRELLAIKQSAARV